MYTLLLATLLGGCKYDEMIAERDIKGQVRIPKAAATRAVKANDDPSDYSTVDVTDLRLMGPIYIGAFAGLDTISRPYPIPKEGPIIASKEGDSFPYGGTSVGRMDFACYKALACKVTTGRFKDYEDILDYFQNVLRHPVVDDSGVPLTTLDATEFQQYCYDYYYATSDAEMSFIGPDNLSFTEDGDDYVADFTLFHTTYQKGMKVWGLMDAPLIKPDALELAGSFSTCDSSAGNSVTRYDETFYEGDSYIDVLNYPTHYLQVDDWVSSGVEVDSADDTVTLNIDVPIVTEE
jgi:hypothetical protein